VQSLPHFSASVFAVAESAENRFSRAIEALDGLARELGTPLAIVGGIAGIRYGTGVTTLDINIVVDASRADDLADSAVRQGWECVNRSNGGWHILRFRDVEGPVDIELLPSGKRTPRDPAGAPAIPTAEKLGVASGVGYAEFAPWVLMKLVAGRDKDRYHLIEAFKKINEPTIASVVTYIRAEASQYLGPFQALLQTAQDEDKTTW